MGISGREYKTFNGLVLFVSLLLAVVDGRRGGGGGGGAAKTTEEGGDGHGTGMEQGDHTGPFQEMANLLSALLDKYNSLIPSLVIVGILGLIGLYVYCYTSNHPLPVYAKHDLGDVQDCDPKDRDNLH